MSDADLDRAIGETLAAAIGRRVAITRRTPLGGGSINRTELVVTDAGSFVVKSNTAAPAGFFRAEADGLETLRASGTSLVIPRVIACRDAEPQLILVEALEPAARIRGFDEQFGRGLAELHRATAPGFGFHRDNFCGLSPQPNRWCASWSEFYATARLRPQVERAARRGLLDTRDRAQFDRLFDRMGSILDDTGHTPALIHGDLWSGNLHVASDGRPALIDPAVSFSHREAEFGMMTLFGGVAQSALKAYEEVWPLSADWRTRVPLYQLYHLLNHLNLFGPGYHAGVMSAVLIFL